jgi:hypothetical protein
MRKIFFVMESLFETLLRCNIPISGWWINLIGTKEVPTPFVIKVQHRSVSFMRIENPCISWNRAPRRPN